MGRTAKVEEDVTPASTLATTPDIDIERLLLHLGRQAEVGQQELEQRHRSPGTLPDAVVVYAAMLGRLQHTLAAVSESARVPSGDFYKSNAFQELEGLKKLVEAELVKILASSVNSSTPLQARYRFNHTLLGILEEFV